MSILTRLCLSLAACLVTLGPLTPAEAAEPAPQVDIVIALDVSGSMSGLIDSARQRLWDVVNDLGRAQPVPVLRVAIVSFGDPSYGAESGFVRLDQPFTRDLDAISRTLFSFQTNGGDEYVARAVATAVDSLQWSTARDALRILFVAGNESALQDPLIGIEQATRAAAERGITVNTIYCGSEQDSVSAEWRQFANLTNGIFASIDQNAAAVAGIATPLDTRLASLNEALNATYLPYGRQGQSGQQGQQSQDSNAAEMSLQALASRTETKAGSLYGNASWDLVDAIAAGAELEQIADQDLPAVLRSMDIDARRDYVAGLAVQREQLKQQIAALAAERRRFIVEQRGSQSSAVGGLDDALRDAIRLKAQDKGLKLADPSATP